MYSQAISPATLSATSSPGSADGPTPSALPDGVTTDLFGPAPVLANRSAQRSRKGTADARHLWPQFERLIRQCDPAIVFGEQVTSADGRTWLAGVRADLEALGYAVGAVDWCAASVASPHVRQRLYWVADADGRDASSERQQRSREHGQRTQDHQDFEGLGIAASEPLRRRGQPWEPSITIGCDDGYRRVGPSTLAMAHGVPNRMGRLRGYGNAIVPQAAAEVISAYLEVRAAA